MTSSTVLTRDQFDGLLTPPAVRKAFLQLIDDLGQDGVLEVPNSEFTQGFFLWHPDARRAYGWAYEVGILPAWSMQGLMFRDADFSFADLSSMLMVGSVFSNAIMDHLVASDANFARCRLDGVCMSYGHLHNANMFRVNAEGLTALVSDFTRARMSFGDFRDAALSGSVFDGVVARDARFNNATMQGTSFVRADLHSASFVDAKLQGSDFGGADLSFVDFTGARLEAVNFTGANLSGTIFESSQLENCTFSDLKSMTTTPAEVIGR